MRFWRNTGIASLAPGQALPYQLEHSAMSGMRPPTMDSSPRSCAPLDYHFKRLHLLRRTYGRNCTAMAIATAPLDDVPALKWNLHFGAGTVHGRGG